LITSQINKGRLNLSLFIAKKLKWVYIKLSENTGIKEVLCHITLAGFVQDVIEVRFLNISKSLMGIRY